MTLSAWRTLMLGAPANADLGAGTANKDFVPRSRNRNVEQIYLLSEQTRPTRILCLAFTKTSEPVG